MQQNIAYGSCKVHNFIIIKWSSFLIAIIRTTSIFIIIIGVFFNKKGINILFAVCGAFLSHKFF